MDNRKTGELIKELRKEKGLTQSQLAQQLHITDRAVSKWERGLCAPDIALLEPLADILDVSILEVIEGRRIHCEEQDVPMEETALNTKVVLSFSKEEIKRKVKTIRAKYMAITAASLAAVILIGCIVLWRGGYFAVLERKPSPDGETVITVYDKGFSNMNIGKFSLDDAVSLIIHNRNGGKTYVTYGDCIYQGIWWAPDSQKYVISLQYDNSVYWGLSAIDKGSEGNLTTPFAAGVRMNEPDAYEQVFSNEDMEPEIDYQFLQWSTDSTSMLIYYTFADASQSLHTGYFWYNCEDHSIHASLVLENEQ